MNDITHCRDCKRKMRRHHMPLKEAPGTVEHSGGGRCKTCHRRHKQGLPPGEIGPRQSKLSVGKCKDCGRQMRGDKTLITEAPETVQYGGFGLCTTDYKKLRHAQFTPRDQYNLTIFDAIKRDRQRRGIPEEGVRTS
jgi:hypothetical protein